LEWTGGGGLDLVFLPSIAKEIEETCTVILEYEDDFIIVAKDANTFIVPSVYEHN
jgi:hypothetical protein